MYVLVISAFSRPYLLFFYPVALFPRSISIDWTSRHTLEILLSPIFPPLRRLPSRRLDDNNPAV